jgi:sugar phosphate isomerase/epimerase
LQQLWPPPVLNYYDVGNSTKGGFDVVEEIGWLGAARICEVHLKDNPQYLGEGHIDFKAVVAALAVSASTGGLSSKADAPF